MRTIRRHFIFSFPVRDWAKERRAWPAWFNLSHFPRRNRHPCVAASRDASDARTSVHNRAHLSLSVTLAVAATGYGGRLLCGSLHKSFPGSAFTVYDVRGAIYAR